MPTAIVVDVDGVVAHCDRVSANDGGGKEGSEIADVARWWTLTSSQIVSASDYYEMVLEKLWILLLSLIVPFLIFFASSIDIHCQTPSPGNPKMKFLWKGKEWMGNGWELEMVLLFAVGEVKVGRGQNGSSSSNRLNRLRVV